MQLPVIFICENNLILVIWIYTCVSLLTECHVLQKRIKLIIILLTVMTLLWLQLAEKAIQRAREGEGPSFIEAITFRWRGHVGPEVDLDESIAKC